MQNSSQSTIPMVSKTKQVRFATNQSPSPESTRIDQKNNAIMHTSHDLLPLRSKGGNNSLDLLDSFQAHPYTQRQIRVVQSYQRQINLPQAQPVIAAPRKNLRKQWQQNLEHPPIPEEPTNLEV